MKTEALIIVNLVQAIKLLLAAVGFFFVLRKAGTRPTSKMEELKEEILELEEDASEVWNKLLEGVPGRELIISVIIGIGVLLLGLVSYMVTSCLTAKSRMNDLKETTNRNLLDLDESERWRYIEAKDKGDQEKKIVEGMDEEDTKMPTVQMTTA